jgi:hypothetical protein
MKNIYRNIAILIFSVLNIIASAKQNTDSIAKANNDIVKHFKLLTPKSKYDMGDKGKIIVTAGFGVNFVSFNAKLRYAESNYFDESRSQTNSSIYVKYSPMYNAVIDYGIGRKVTIGAAFGYQRASVNWTSYDTPYNPNYGYYSYSYPYPIHELPQTDTWTRIHVAVRGDYRIISKDELGMYTGVRLGYNLYHMSSTYSVIDPTYENNLGVSFLPFSVQAHFGFSYWVEGIIGINTEIGIGIGGPYVGAIGITGKF